MTHSGESTYSIIRRETKWVVDRFLMVLFIALLVHVFMPNYSYFLQVASGLVGVTLTEIILYIVGVIRGKH